ncbi:MAG TPA: HEAT repeat domain-containing protein [Nitrospiraceae bacterium]|nr:HEAT repeat domain-containing protein [Nitrospiraceae bacterium]
MKMRVPSISVVAAALILAGLSVLPSVSGATSLKGDGAAPGNGSGSSPKSETVTKDDIVTQYVGECGGKSPKDANCDKLKIDAVEILKEDLHTLGSSANRAYMPKILPMFKSNEPELRIAAADAMGMIGLQDGDSDVVAPLANDPVPDVRKAVTQMIQRGKGPSLTLLGQRMVSVRTGLTPETAPDPSKFMMPVAPASTYLFYSSDIALGRLTYLAKGMNEAMTFFKGKAKRGPLKLEEFQEKYRYQLDDEQRARESGFEEVEKKMELVKPDPANMTAYMESIAKVQEVMANRTMAMAMDQYSPDLFGSPTVYVLEERQIGQRSYPTRYVVLYQDQALKRPGYRLAWMTAPDDSIKVEQTASLASEKEEQAHKKEGEALQKRQEALEDLVKKKSEQEKKQFKKGQADLEKELGF